MTTPLTLGNFVASFRVKRGDAPFIMIRRADAVAPEPTHTPRLRRESAGNVTGRGTGRGGKAPAERLTRLLKPYGKRQLFVQFIGGNETSVESLRQHFGMSEANINGYLMNIHRDHGIGYAKEGGTVRLILPKGSTWSTIWGPVNG